MFQDMTKIMNRSMAPMRDLVSVQTKMLESLTRQQMECTKACLEATLQQTQALQQCQSPQDLLALQQSYAKELEETLTQSNAENMKALQDARQEMERVTEDTFNAFAAGNASNQ